MLFCSNQKTSMVGNQAIQDFRKLFAHIKNTLLLSKLALKNNFLSIEKHIK